MSQGHLKMGDLTRTCGVSDQAARLYERMGLLKPIGRTAKGYRLYDAGSVETLCFIKQAQRSGFSLEEIKALLHMDLRNEQACSSMKELLDRKISTLSERLAELAGMQSVLQSLREACDGEPGPSCPAFLKLRVPQGAVPDPKVAAACPACGIEGKPVKPVTLRSLLQPRLRPQVRDEGYRFCASQDCALVYYSAGGAQVFTRGDLTVRVGLKERSAPRPLCYCFNHGAESIQEEWTRTGKTTVVEAIKAELKAGGCHCEITNPSGGCCLGDVIKEVKALTSAPPGPAPAHDCCTPSNPSCH